LVFLNLFLISGCQKDTSPIIQDPDWLVISIKLRMMTPIMEQLFICINGMIIIIMMFLLLNVHAWPAKYMI
jgi:hypothetical protein